MIPVSKYRYLSLLSDTFSLQNRYFTQLSPAPASRPEPTRFPVKLTDPPTAVLYITPDWQHLEDLKHTIHVKEVNLGQCAGGGGDAVATEMVAGSWQGLRWKGGMGLSRW